MRLRRKILLVVVLLVFVAGGALYYIKSRDHYDPSKYKATVTGGLESGGLQKGTKLDLTLPDQFDVSHTVGPEITTLILAFSKTTGGTVRSYLDKQDPDYLSRHKAVFIADISFLPVVLRNTVGLPQLRESPYPVLLIYEDEMSRSLQNEAHGGKITVATLDKGVVQRVEYITSKKELASVFR